MATIEDIITTAPHPRLIIPGSSRRVSMIGAAKSKAMVDATDSGGESISRPRSTAPALLTKTSMGPFASSIRRTKAGNPATSVRSKAS
jgi:hypothetical protein